MRPAEAVYEDDARAVRGPAVVDVVHASPDQGGRSVLRHVGRGESVGGGATARCDPCVRAVPNGSRAPIQKHAAIAVAATSGALTPAGASNPRRAAASAIRTGPWITNATKAPRAQALARRPASPRCGAR